MRTCHKTSQSYRTELIAIETLFEKLEKVAKIASETYKKLHARQPTLLIITDSKSSMDAISRGPTQPTHYSTNLAPPK